MIEPYISMKGNAGEAIDFYEKVFNGRDKLVMRYKDAPPNPQFPVPEHMKDLVLHSDLNIAGTKIHLSDGQRDLIPGNMISFAVNFSSPDEVEAVYNKLKEGGEVLMELGPQFFSPMYAFVRDKYGIGWQLIYMK